MKYQNFLYLLLLSTAIPHEFIQTLSHHKLNYSNSNLNRREMQTQIFLSFTNRKNWNHNENVAKFK